MIRKTLFAVMTVMVVPALLAAYTVVLKDGRRIEAREKHTVAGGVVQFVGVDGQVYRLAVTEVDLDATLRANPSEAGRPTKFVWTNEEIERLPPSRRVNIVGTRPAEAPAEPAREAAPAEAAAGEAGAEGEAPTEQPRPLPPREQDPAYYRDRLQPLRAELAQVESRISALRQNIQTGGGGARTSVVPLLEPSTGVDPRDTLQQLERRRDDLQRQIASIEAEARRQGLSPGQIR